MGRMTLLRKNPPFSEGCQIHPIRALLDAILNLTLKP